MDITEKLYRVERYVEPEWGPNRIEWVKYFLAIDKDTVLDTVNERHGKAAYYSMDREALKYSVREVSFEVLGERVEQDEDSGLYGDW